MNICDIPTPNSESRQPITLSFGTKTDLKSKPKSRWDCKSPVKTPEKKAIPISKEYSPSQQTSSPENMRDEPIEVEPGMVRSALMSRIPQICFSVESYHK